MFDRLAESLADVYGICFEFNSWSILVDAVYSVFSWRSLWPMQCNQCLIGEFFGRCGVCPVFDWWIFEAVKRSLIGIGGVSGRYGLIDV